MMKLKNFVVICGNSHRQLYELIGNYLILPYLTLPYERVFSQIDTQQFTQDTLDCSFHRICSEVFTHRPTSNGYIVAVQYTSITVLLLGTLLMC